MQAESPTRFSCYDTDGGGDIGNRHSRCNYCPNSNPDSNPKTLTISLTLSLIITVTLTFTLGLTLPVNPDPRPDPHATLTLTLALTLMLPDIGMPELIRAVEGFLRQKPDLFEVVRQKDEAIRATRLKALREDAARIEAMPVDGTGRRVAAEHDEATVAAANTAIWEAASEWVMGQTVREMRRLASGAGFAGSTEKLSAGGLSALLSGGEDQNLRQEVVASFTASLAQKGFDIGPPMPLVPSCDRIHSTNPIRCRANSAIRRQAHGASRRTEECRAAEATRSPAEAAGGARAGCKDGSKERGLG